VLRYWPKVTISFFLISSLTFEVITSFYSDPVELNLLRGEEKKLDFRADRGEYQTEENRLDLSGNVSIFCDQAELKAEKVMVKEKKITAQGNVVFVEKGKKITASVINYNTENKVANFLEGKLIFAPWYLSAKRIEKTGEKKFISSGSLLTTCELSSPHYFFKARKIDLILEDRLSIRDVLFYVHGIPLFYLPFYWRSLKERRMSVEIYPGYSESEGFYLRNKIGYPVSKNTYAKVYLDYLEKKGWGTGGEYNYNLPNNIRGTVFAYRIKEKDTSRERWNLRYIHWSQLTQNFTLTTNLNLLNDYNFSNLYFREDWQRLNREIKSYLNLTYSEKNFTFHMIIQDYSCWDFDHFRSTETYVPRFTLFTQPVKSKLLPLLFYNFSFDLSNHYTRTKGFYQLETEDSLSVTNRFNLSRALVLIPQITLSITNKTDPRNLLRQYYQTKTNLRYRPVDLFSFDFGYDYAAEFGKSAGTKQLSFLSQWQPTRRMDWRATGGYNFITKKKNDFVNQLTYYPKENIATYLANIYSLEKQEILSWQIEFTLGKLRKEYLLVGFTYSAPDKYYLRSGFAYAPTKSWKIEFTGRQDFSHGVSPYFEKEISLTRDLHCWVLNLYYRDRSQVKEFWFSLDLKIAGEARESLYLRKQEAEWYPWR